MCLRASAPKTALIVSAVCFFLTGAQVFAQAPGVNPVSSPGSSASPASAPGAAPRPQASPAARPVVVSGPVWAGLTPAQKQALAPLERDWPSIDTSRRAKWIELANRFPAMPADERQRMQDRMSEWARLSPEERGRARLSFQEAKQLSPQERQARWEAYQALPEEDRKALASRAQDKRDRPAGPTASALLAAVPKQSPGMAASGPSVLVKPVAPTVVQAKPGATTTLMTRSPSPPPHQKPGQPKIDAQPDKVDRTTLLPQRGPQGSGAKAPLPTPAASK